MRACGHTACMSEPNEILPGVLHWTTRHPNIGADVSSYYLVDEGIFIDPLLPDGGLDWFAEREPREVLLTNRHHTRSAFDLRKRFGIPIRAPQTGMHDLPADEVTPYEFGESLTAGIRPHGIFEGWPDETALEIPSHRAVAIADGVINYGGLRFVPDDLMGDEAEEDKQGLAAGFARVAEDVDFDHLLIAHGEPIVGGGREALRRFASGE
jgi:hypothetical protein